MSHFRILSALVLCGMVCMLGLSASAAGAAPGGTLTRLPNGLAVYVLKDTRFPLVCTRLYVRTGSANEEPRLAGISHLLEHMVFKGTEHRPKGEVAKAVEAVGGYINAATSFDKTWYLADVPAKHWQVGMDVVRDMAFEARFDSDELEAEKEVVISELRKDEDSPMRVLYEELQTAGLKNTSYGRPIIGFVDTIKAITVSDLRDYVRRWYQPQNMLLLVAGDIDPAAVLEHARKLFGGLANSVEQHDLPPCDLTGAPGGPVAEVRRGPWDKVYLGLSFPAPPLGDQRSVELDVLAYLLAGDGAARLDRKYRYEERLVDSISVGNMSLDRAGLLTVTAQMDVGKVADFWEKLTYDLATLNAGDFNMEELQRARLNVLDDMDRAGETLTGLAGWQGIVQFSLGGEQGERNLRETLQRISLERLQESIARWFDPGRCRIRVLAPQNAELPDFEAVLRKNWPAGKKEKTANSAVATGEREVVELGSGRTVILIPDGNVPYMSLNLLFAGGNALLKPEQQGLAGLVARLLTDGCGAHDAQEMERLFSERAASVSANAGQQSFGLSLSGPARFNADYFRFVSLMLHEPHFADKELAREVENMKFALRQRMDQPLRYLFSRLGAFLFPGGHCYGFDGLGSPESLDALKRKDVLDFWGTQRAMPWVLAVAGAFDREEVLAFARALPAPSAQHPTVDSPVWGKDRELSLHLPGRSQAHLMRIFPTVPLTHEDAPALMLLENVLSGQSGILFSDLRDRQGLGYTVTAFERFLPQAGFMVFYIGTASDKLEQARIGFDKVIARLVSEVLPKELLAVGANRMLGEYLREKQSLASRAGEASVNGILGYPLDFERQLLEKAATLTPEQIRAVAQKYLVPDKAYEAVLMP